MVVPSQRSLPKQMIHSVCLIALSMATYSAAFGFPPYDLSRTGRDPGDIPETLDFNAPEPPPGPLVFNGTKLVNDEDHPWMPPAEGDVRGPCPGLNTLASHGVRLVTF